LFNKISSISDKARYFAWAATRYYGADKSCPACGDSNTVALHRKALVTELFECERCSLRFRVPKDSQERSVAFYQHTYNQGITTDCPDESQLQQLIQSEFRGSEKDFGPYLKVLEAIGVQPGSVVLDYGSSWGYGSWQLTRAGFSVYSYEISAPRAEYARKHLHCEVLAAPDALPASVDVFFSAHVIEHLPDPNLLWNCARKVLKPTGVIVLFMPNGDPSVEAQRGEDYHSIWGLVHPLVLSAKALTAMAGMHGFSGQAYSSPYHFNQIKKQQQGNLSGDELLYIARRQVTSIRSPNV